MKNKPRGTNDIYFPLSLTYQKIQEVCQNVLNKASYQPIILPIYEYAELFSSSLGEGSDIVHKEMFIFSDRKGRNLVLRPEGTASSVRLVSHNKLVNSSYPLRLYYWGKMFRYERPQKGRYREFVQLGVELVNAQGIIADGELFWLIKEIFLNLNLSEFIIRWNYLGNEDSKKKYKEILKNFLIDKLENLCLDCQKRYDSNPLRILDCKVCEKNSFPPYLQALNKEDLNYQKEVKKFFDFLNIANEYNNYLVRGLDYYTGIVFEIYWKKDNDQLALGGGGRYDNLFQQLGGKNLPAAGFALGIDRLANLVSLEINHSPDVLFLGLELASYPLIINWRTKLCQKYQTVCNLKIAQAKEVFKSINYYSPKITVIVGKKELKEKKILVRDCQEKKDFLINEEKLVSWILECLSNKKLKI